MDKESIEKIYGQIQSGNDVSVAVVNSSEAEEIANDVLVYHQLKVAVKPAFIWMNEVEIHKGFVLTKA